MDEAAPQIKSKTSRKLTVAIFVIVLLICGSVAAYFFVTSQPKPAPQQTSGQVVDEKADEEALNKLQSGDRKATPVITLPSPPTE